MRQSHAHTRLQCTVPFAMQPASTSMQVDARHWPLYRGRGVAKGTLGAVLVLFAAHAGGISLAINTATKLVKKLLSFILFGHPGLLFR